MSMRLFEFLVLSAQLVMACPVVDFQENGLQHEQPFLKLDLYHVQGHNSPLNPSSRIDSPFSDMILRDEERVRTLRYKKANLVQFRSQTSSGEQKKVVTVPSVSGMSIGSGNYYVKIGLGTPAKYFRLLIDTGSSFTWIQCLPCTIYCHSQIDPFFNSSSSKSYKKVSCSNSLCSLLKNATLNDPLCKKPSGLCMYSATYGDSSSSVGYMSQDMLTIAPSETAQPFVYGCGQNNEGLYGKTSGILGLSTDKLSMISQLSTKYGNAFSYCLPTASSIGETIEQETNQNKNRMHIQDIVYTVQQRVPTSTATLNMNQNGSNSRSPMSSNGGFLSIGNSSLKGPSSYNFTPMIKDSNNPSLYFLNLTTIKVADKPLKVAASSYNVPTIIDSGTVISRLPMLVYTALQESFASIMSKSKYKRVPGYAMLDTCFKESVKGMAMVPEIEMIFEGGAGLKLKPLNVLIETEKGVKCLAFAGSYESDRIAIIGNFQQQTFTVSYDISKSRIGFAADGCN